MFSPDTLDLFAKLLSMIQLQVGDDDFEVTAQRVITAKRELAEARSKDKIRSVDPPQPDQMPGPGQ